MASNGQLVLSTSYHLMSVEVMKVCCLNTACFCLVILYANKRTIGCNMGWLCALLCGLLRPVVDPMGLLPQVYA